jgi:hypothetical protein
MSKHCLLLVMLLFAFLLCLPFQLFSQVTQDVDVLLWCSAPARASSSDTHWLDLAPVPGLLVAGICVLAWLESTRRGNPRLFPG